MDLPKIYKEEDLFPREFADSAERAYGMLFYNDNDKDSYDSNHAIIFKDMENCFLWPDGESAERIYDEAGFRLVEVKKAARACYLK